MNSFFKTLFLFPILFHFAVAFAVENNPTPEEKTEESRLADFVEEQTAKLRSARLGPEYDRLGSLYDTAIELQSSIRNQNTERYSRQIQHLLTVPIGDFLQVLLFKSEKGNNIFHLMAEVQDPKARAFFAQDMQTLFDLFTGRLNEKASLGGREIVIPPLPEDHLLIRAVEEKLSLSEPAKARHLITLLKQGPAIEFIKTIYARDGQGRRFTERFAIYLNSLPAFSSSEELVHKLQEMSDILGQKLRRSLFHKKNEQGKRPIDIAYNTGNPQAYRVLNQESFLKDRSSSVFNTGLVGGLVATVIFGITIMEVDSVRQIFGPLIVNQPGWVLPVMAGISIPLIGGLSQTCYSAVREIKLKRLKK